MLGEQKLVRYVQTMLVFGGCVLLVMPASIFPSYYKPWMMGVVAFLYSFLIQLPVFLFPISPRTTGSARKLFLRGRVQVALAVGLVSTSLGSLGLWGLYRVGIPYDKLVHFFFLALLMVSFSYFFQAWYGWSFGKTVIIVGLVLGCSGVLWECIEYGSDRWLHFGFFGSLFDHDSLFDIYNNLLGIIAGTVIIGWHRWKKRKYMVE